MANSRSKNAIINILVGIISQVLMLILSFAGRAVFVRYLDVSYLGINGLFSNILSVLALAELGLGNVTQFLLYKPVADNDEQMICSRVRYFRKLYCLIAGTIFILGVGIIPFLPHIVNCELPFYEMVIYYVLFLLNSVVSYFSAHKIALLMAYQDNRLQKYIMLATNFVVQVLHIIVLHLWHNYMIYICITVFSTLIQVILLNVVSNIRYPFLKSKSTAKISSEDRKYIISNVKSTFVYKIGATIINNTDNILISMIISTTAVGLYSNYYMVVLAVQGFLGIVTTSLIPSIGNLSTTGNKTRMLQMFDMMVLFYHAISAFGAVAFYFLFDDLIPIWLGSQFMLDHSTVFSISLNFYIINAISPIWMFREANGLFNKVKYLLLTTAAFNIFFSIGMGKLWGMTGILLATSVSRIITQVWYEPNILFNNVFQTSQKNYWIKQSWYLFLSLISFMGCYGITLLLPHNFISMVVKGLLFAAVFGIVFFIGNIHSDTMKELHKIVLYAMHRHQ